MNKFIIIFFIITASCVTEVIIELCDLFQPSIDLVDSHTDGIPDTDTSENSEDVIEINSNYILLPQLLFEHQNETCQSVDYSIESYLEVPDPPPEDTE